MHLVLCSRAGRINYTEVRVDPDATHHILSDTLLKQLVNNGGKIIKFHKNIKLFYQGCYGIKHLITLELGEVLLKKVVIRHDCNRLPSFGRIALPLLSDSQILTVLQQRQLQICLHGTETQLPR